MGERERGGERERERDGVGVRNTERVGEGMREKKREKRERGKHSDTLRNGESCS